LLLLGGALLFLGTDTLRQIAFPLAFLVFTLPFPLAVREWLEGFFQNTSADAASFFFWLAGMPAVRDDLQVLQIQLPGITLEVAPECSGIHSSLVLFITSLLAGYHFLRAPWKRAALALAVIPLGFLRNGFRIFVIGELCVNVNPDMINSRIHRQGGPVFFALSLIPLFLLLFLLRRGDSKTRQTGQDQDYEEN
jgi:exosortase C (VPDSG-CTERM-specific)